MFTLIKFAVRNVLRNKKRSLLTALSVFIATIAVTFGIGFFNGTVNGVLRNTINYTTGNFKVTTADYVRYERYLPVDDYIPNSGDLAVKISKIKGVLLVEERVRFAIVLGKGENTQPALGVGADLRSKYFDLENKLTQGKLDDEGLYICEGLAEKMKIKIGDDILLVTSTAERGLNGIKLKIKGIISFGISMIDKRTLFIDLQNARKLLKMQNGITELTIFTGKKADLSRVQNEIRKMLPAGMVIQDPDQQTGGLYNIMLKTLYAFYILFLLILLLASFVIVNTMVMSVYERMKEIGTLKALGMTDRDIFFNFTLEGIFIGCFGGISGSLLGYLLTIYSSVKGLNFSSMVKNREIPINMIIYPSADIQVLFIAIIMAIIVSAISACIPARRARKMSPAEALRQL